MYSSTIKLIYSNSALIHHSRSPSSITLPIFLCRHSLLHCPITSFSIQLLPGHVHLQIFCHHIPNHSFIGFPNPEKHYFGWTFANLHTLLHAPLIYVQVPSGGGIQHSPFVYTHWHQELFLIKQCIFDQSLSTNFLHHVAYPSRWLHNTNNPFCTVHVCLQSSSSVQSPSAN